MTHTVTERGGGDGRTPDWKDYAACRGRDVNLFFGPDDEAEQARERRETEAKSVCVGCPVRAACLAHAIGYGERYGIFGGTTEDERWTDRRNAIRRERARERAA